MHPASPPPPLQLLQLLQGYQVARALGTASELRVADILDGGPLPIDELAAQAGAHPEALGRLLRALASLGIFAQREDGRFEQTALSAPLSAKHPSSVRDYLLFTQADGPQRAWSRLTDVVRTGASLFEEENGQSCFSYLASHPEVARHFDRGMTQMSVGLLSAIGGVCNLSEVESLVDVGGGQGHLLAALLGAHPALRGVLFDLPHALPRAEEFLERAGLRARCEVVGGDFFSSVPSGHGAYLLKAILHDWDDSNARRILAAVRTAIPSHGRLLVIEALLEPGNAPQPAKWLDLQMLVVLGGRERTRAEFERLFDESGFGLTGVTAIPGVGQRLIEAQPR
jgi:hypothetical protein